MSGNLQNLLNSTQPTDHGNTSSETKKLPSQPSPLLIARPTGALHPAFLTPISAGPAQTQSPSHPYPQPSPSSANHLRTPSWSISHQPSPSSSSLASHHHRHPHHANVGSTSRSPTRSSSSSTSGGLHGLADVAMMDAGRRSPGLKSQASGRRFWDDGAKGGESEPTSSSSTCPFPDRPSTSGRASLHREQTNSIPTYPPQSHYTTSAPVSRLQSPTRPSTATSAPSRHQPSHQTSSSLPASSKSASQPNSAPPTASAKAPTPKLPVFGPELPHPLLNVNLDREYNPPTTEEWERRALRVLQLPRIPLSMRNPPPPFVPDPTPKPLSPPMTALSSPPPSSTLPADKATRAKRGGDRRPRATPHSAAWAEDARKIVPQDEDGRRIHPPPGGIIPPPANGKGNYLPNLLSTSTPPPTDPSGSFESFTTDRRATARSHQQDAGSESSRSSRVSGGRGGEGNGELGDGVERNGERVEASGVRYSDAEVDTVLRLNLKLQSQQEQSVQAIDRLKYELSERDEQLVKLREELEKAKSELAEKQVEGAGMMGRRGRE